MGEILASNSWASNAYLIENIARLGYIHEEDVTIDLTYGLGIWWQRWAPAALYRHDIDPEKAPDGALDFTNPFTLYSPESFQVVAFDPPYKLNGTPDDAVDGRYGVHEVRTIEQRHELMTRGLEAAVQLLQHRGILLFKCMNQVSSGKVRWQVDHFTALAMLMGMHKEDQFNFLTQPRPQPEGRAQVHARQNYSTLIVFRKDQNRAVSYV